MEDVLAQFIAITDASASKAEQYLSVCDFQLENAIELFYSNDGAELHSESASRPAPPAAGTANQPYTLDSDDEENGRGAQNGGSREDDEIMARRLQDEMYGGPAGGDDGYRAPIARTTETLVGPDSYDLEDPEDRHAAILDQLRRRQQARRPVTQQGIFHQDEDREDRGQPRSAKASQLAEMYRPPFDLICRHSWHDARDLGKTEKKWLLVNVQDTSIFDCQILNRDLWKDEGVKQTIQESFLFMQFTKDDPRGDTYSQYYFQQKDNADLYPHIAIVDPRTGEQVKVWSGPPAPKPAEFLMQLHEFLDRYSLDVGSKNPVAKRKPEPRRESKIERMTEDEQLQMAMNASLNEGTSAGQPADDPDILTRSIADLAQNGANGDDGMHIDEDEAVPSTASPFDAISSTNPHTEPPADAASTRIQFRHPAGRIVRRFSLADQVLRIYEWLKAEPIPGQDGKSFELIAMGKNLIESLDQTVEQAGLKNGTVMIEFV